MRATPLSYSLVLMHGDSLYAIRDPFGNRPLCIGRVMERSDEDESHAASRSAGKQNNFEASLVQPECLDNFTAARPSHLSAPTAHRSESFKTAVDVQQIAIAKRLLNSFKSSIDSVDCTPRRTHTNSFHLC